VFPVVVAGAGDLTDGPEDPSRKPIRQVLGALGVQSSVRQRSERAVVPDRASRPARSSSTDRHYPFPTPGASHLQKSAD